MSSYGFLLLLLIYPAIAALIFGVSYFVIRNAIRSALRQHQLWLDSREPPSLP